MSFSDRVATLIANPSNPCLTAQIAKACSEAVNASGLYFLADGIACDIPLPADCNDAEKRLAAEIADQPIDIVVQNADDRRKKALVADMDSTMIQQECIDELADEADIGSKVADITARAMRGEIEFDSALRERVGLLKDQPESIIEKVLETRIQLMPGGPQLLATMKANGAYCALVSGGFTQFTSAIAQKLGFDENRANTFDIENGAFTGKVIDPILGREAKVEAMHDVAKLRGIELEDIMAVGDGANDLGMLTIAGSGVALHAKPIVAEQAKFRINHGDLTALLYIQGYRQTDIVG